MPLPPRRPAQTANDDVHANWIKPLAFVNLREGPSPSAPVISVVAKGAKLSVIGRKQRLGAGDQPRDFGERLDLLGQCRHFTKSQRGSRRAAHSESPPGSDSLWPSLGQWLASP